MKRFCIPPRNSGPFVAAMEDVLDVYERPYDPSRPVVCFDETSKQLVEHCRTPLPARPGVRARVDDEYKRCGTANIFLAVEPLTGEVIVCPTDRRTSKDCAEFLRFLSDEVYPKATQIVLVSDNLSTHGPACFYETFPPEEARRLTRRFEWHHTPKHGSWLDVAECELSVMGRACLRRRIPNFDDLRRTLDAWVQHRKVKAVKWQFTCDKARVKLARLYPITLTETKH